MANVRKPAQLKSISGTGQKCREVSSIVDLPVLSSVPSAPDWLPNSHAVKEWHRLAGILTANKLLTEAALSSLGMLCALHGKVIQTYEAGEVPIASMCSTLRNMQNDFGLTPVAHGKVKPIGETGKGNKFKGNGQR